MSHLLDNMIWNALTTGNREIAIVEGEVGCYKQDIAPFVGLQELNETNLQKLYDFLPAGRRVAISYNGKVLLDKSKWEIVQQMQCCQMVYVEPISSFITKGSHLIVPLGIEHVQQMMELTALTKPGPFFQTTISFGNYFGIFIGGKLVAMTGQRMHPIPFMEVSAVCTHPDYRGNGYAKTLMLHVMKIILDNFFIPFLHVLTSNSSAIHLYASIGFRTRKEINIDVIKKL